MFFVLQVCFWIKEALGHFFFPWEQMHFESIGTRFSAPVVLFLPKSNTGKRCSCGCFLAWSSTGQGVKLRRSQVERARSLQDEKKIEELLVRIFENFALQISRLGDLGICVFANEKVWGGEGEKICRWEEDKILYSKKMRGWDHVEELKVFCQEYT